MHDYSSISLSELCRDVLGVSRQQFYAWEASGVDLPRGFRTVAGSHRRFRITEVQKWLAAREAASSVEAAR
ncbi:hypothetical protein QBK99_08135 [Corticibacterium sp. UT-5YL-CI-8]|nr:hypothetical protein [Tianweitania sp. UT-5YL-CI-8]